MLSIFSTKIVTVITIFIVYEIGKEDQNRNGKQQL